MDDRIQILPSLLAADSGNLETAARRAETAGADALHLDIMDGHFVPNLSMGPDVVKMCRRCVRLPLNVHLMISNPHLHLERFIRAGATTLLVHAELDADVPALLRRIRELGARPGLALNPETPVSRARAMVDGADEVLCMTVHPGFGGQAFMPEVLPKIAELRATALSRRSQGFDLSVDGGIDLGTVGSAVQSGARMLVAGTALFGAADFAVALDDMRRKAEHARG